MDCQFYTRARRHEIMVGKVGDIPVPAAHWWQPAALIVTVIALWLTRGWWWQLWLPVRTILFLGALVGAWFGMGRFTTNPLTSVAGLAVHIVDRWWPAARKDREPSRLVIRIPVVDYDPPEEPHA